MGEDDSERGDCECQPDSVKEDSSDVSWKVLSGAPCNQRLQAVVQPVANDGEHEIIDTGNTGRRQFGLTQTRKENVVGDKIDLRNQYRQ